jgi:hypothetical protein
MGIVQSRDDPPLFKVDPFCICPGGIKKLFPANGREPPSGYGKG